MTWRWLSLDGDRSRTLSECVCGCMWIGVGLPALSECAAATALSECACDLGTRCRPQRCLSALSLAVGYTGAVVCTRGRVSSEELAGAV
jgi:hypothetical protein